MEDENSLPDEHHSKEVDETEVKDDLPKNKPLAAIPSKPCLKPKSLLAHELLFGSLANEASGTGITLSAVQLFDLATALDEYSTELETLPQLNPSKKKKAIRVWATAAAGVILTVGLSTVGVKIFNPSESETDSVASVVEQKAPNRTPAKISEVLPPDPPSPETSKPPSPNLPESLSSQKKLPPPPKVNTPTPPTRKTTSQTTIPTQTPTPLPPAPPVTTNPLPTKTTLQPPPAPTEKKDIPKTIPTFTGTAKLPELPPLPTQSRESQDTNQIIQISPKIPNQDSSSVASVPLAVPSSPPKESEGTTTTATRLPSDRLLNNLPQVNEVRDYFQQKWQPPESLTKTLEYRLVLNSNGSIKRIIPLGRASGIYLDRTNMPLMGETFVSPIPGGVNPNIRVVLAPDGTVKTFLE